MIARWVVPKDGSTKFSPENCHSCRTNAMATWKWKEKLRKWIIHDNDCTKNTAQFFANQNETTWTNKLHVLNKITSNDRVCWKDCQLGHSRKRKNRTETENWGNWCAFECVFSDFIWRNSRKWKRYYCFFSSVALIGIIARRIVLFKSAYVYFVPDWMNLLYSLIWIFLWEINSVAKISFLPLSLVIYLCMLWTTHVPKLAIVALAFTVVQSLLSYFIHNIYKSF